ncbi:hypothetical protein Cni_G00656 [Canna indica]|uniref:Uncharacterized protein n=1 Tax=Canna indica TaxID=4628 RepID=A0AAQ3PWZ3_9LILI|nr:hypothetical protein Cni_G00656 [Canna indica]
MDLETENYLASLLMEEARRLRLQSETEGVHAYLRKPNVRGRPNSRFLTATVLGVQQANRAVEVTEMWRAREKELELQARINDNTKMGRDKRSRAEKHQTDSQRVGSSSRHEQENTNTAISYSSSKEDLEDYYSDKDGLRDEEVEKFLRSRAKRGRGTIGSRMDETGPFPSQTSCAHDEHLLNSDVRVKEEWEHRILGPEKPSLKPHKLPVDDFDVEARVDSSRKCHSKNRKSEEKSRSKKESRKKKHKEKRSKHHHKRRRGKD